MPRFARKSGSSDSADGFSDMETPNWLTLPNGERRSGLVLIDGTGFSISSASRGVVQVIDPAINRVVDYLEAKSATQPVTFEGVTPGAAYINVWKRTGAGRATGGGLLKVHVLAKKTVAVAFHYLEDGGGHRTKRALGSEDALLTATNKVFKQASVTFKKVGAGKKLKLTQTLSNPLTDIDLGGTGLPTLKMQCDTSARINVFFTWEFEVVGSGLKDLDALADKSVGIVVFEDKVAGKHGLSLAHEFGHILNLEHRDSEGDQLMWPEGDSSIRAAAMPLADILEVNKNA